MSAPIPFEKHRFRSAAEHYRKGRPALCAGAVRAGGGARRLDARSRRARYSAAVPGQLALGFAPFAGSVTAIDPEPEMLRIAAADAVRGRPRDPFHRRQLL